MKLKDFILLDTQLKAKCGIGITELHLLSFIAEKMESKQVTITLLLDQYNHASPATTHKRLDALIKAKIIKKTINDEDSRIKTLGRGIKFDDLVKLLKEF